MSGVVINLQHLSAPIGSNGHNITDVTSSAARSGVPLVDDCDDFVSGDPTGIAFDITEARTADANGSGAGAGNTAILNDDGHYATGTDFNAKFSGLVAGATCDVTLYLSTNFSDQILNVDINGVEVLAGYNASYPTIYGDGGQAPQTFSGIVADGSGEINIYIEDTVLTNEFVMVNAIELTNIVNAASLGFTINSIKDQIDVAKPAMANGPVRVLLWAGNSWAFPQVVEVVGTITAGVLTVPTAEVFALDDVVSAEVIHANGYHSYINRLNAGGDIQIVNLTP